MPNVFLSTGNLYLDGDTPIIAYTVVVVGPPNHLYGGTYELDPTLSMDDNMIALWQQVVSQAEEKGGAFVASDLGGFGTKVVTDADLAKVIEKSDVKVAAGESEPIVVASAEKGMWGKFVDNVKSMWSA
jgi:hypothetical protein